MIIGCHLEWISLLGYQERDMLGNKTNFVFANHATENNWLVDTNNYQYISTQYIVNHTENMTFKASIRPIKSLRIDLLQIEI